MNHNFYILVLRNFHVYRFHPLFRTNSFKFRLICLTSRFRVHVLQPKLVICDLNILSFCPSSSSLLFAIFLFLFVYQSETRFEKFILEARICENELLIHFSSICENSSSQKCLFSTECKVDVILLICSSLMHIWFYLIWFISIRTFIFIILLSDIW